MYTFWLVLHVLAVLVLAGPAFAMPYFRFSFTEPNIGQLRLANHLARSSALFLVVQLVTGIALLVASGDASAVGKEAWFSISMVLFIVLGGIGTGYNLPRLRKALKAAEAGDFPAVGALVKPVSDVTGPIASLVGAAILILMVWQPGT